ncbi:hypothetical protein H8B08_14675 [Caulobacter sp. 17J80-11]|nr:DUF6249 domain-containing protein [Caulobacter sp. 17J80-11]MBC6982990.1 hypothetical protein [Caulobacter sp. 17J80-11]
MIAAIVIVPGYLKSQERQKLQETLRVAFEKGQDVPPEVLDAMTRDIKPSVSPYRDVRRGVVMLAIAAALATIGGAWTFYEGFDDAWGWFTGAAFPGFIGIAYLLLGLFAKDRKG